MTLIEIMVVVILIAGVVTVGVSQLGGPGREMRKNVRRISSLAKTLHTRAKLLRKTYRLVIFMDKENESHQYWVESSTGKVKLVNEEKQIELSKLTTLQREGILKDPGFSIDVQITKKPRTLSSPLEFKNVEFAQKNAPITKGKAYIHFFPEGLVEEAAIHLTGGEKLNWTISFHPVTGRTFVVSREAPLKDLLNYEDR